MKKNNKEKNIVFEEKIKKFKPFQTPKITKPIIQIKNLKKHFRRWFKKNYVLNGINLDIADGDRIALLGANGAGKTTLIEILSGINKPTKGQIIYNYDFKKTPQEKIGIQFQDCACPIGLNVFDIINFQNSINEYKISESELYNLLQTFRLDTLLNSKASRLSIGQQQRLNIFLSLMNNPRVLFLDELSTALDVQMQFSINDFIKKFIDKNKITLILSSHNASEILKFANRIVILKEGKIAIDVPLKSIIKTFKNIEYFLDNYLR